MLEILHQLSPEEIKLKRGNTVSSHVASIPVCWSFLCGSLIVRQWAGTQGSVLSLYVAQSYGRMVEACWFKYLKYLYQTSTK